MRLTDVMSEELVVASLKGTARDDVLAEVVDCIIAVRPELERVRTLQVLLERERLSSTGVGAGFAIPHGKRPELKSMVVCFARSTPGVEFGALDGHRSHLFLTLLAPEGAALHLKALARASRLLKDADFRARLIAEPDRSTLWRLLREKDDHLAKEDRE
ncbi:MAG: PTS sugar transporter subunit IIA [Deltaproteobacteria bacterium]|nr:PTS sugar transporter subunit IIA [Deltaproteobacteria bacterium]